MTTLILVACAIVGFKLGQFVVRIGRSLNAPGFGSGRFMFNVNE